MEDRGSPQKMMWGVIILVGAFFIGTVQNVLIKLISNQTPISMILFIQYLVCTVVCFPIFYRKRETIFKKQNLGLLITRAFAGLAYYFFMFQALRFIHLTDVALLSNTAPLWVPVLGLVFLQRKIKFSVYLLIIIGFIGVGFILTPDGNIINRGSILALVAGLSMGGALLAVKQLSDKEPVERVLFFYFVIAALIMLPTSLVHWQHLSLHLWGVVILNGLLMVAQQVLVYYGFRCGPANKLSITTYSAVIFSVFFDWIIWHQIITIKVFIGAAFIIFSAVCILMPPKSSDQVKKNLLIKESE